MQASRGSVRCRRCGAGRDGGPVLGLDHRTRRDPGAADEFYRLFVFRDEDAGNFKRFLANLRRLIGGRVKSYESILDRARREALLRMKTEAFANVERAHERLAGTAATSMAAVPKS